MVAFFLYIDKLVIEEKHMKFYKCAHCGKIIALINDVNVPTICCGEVMQEIKENTVDAAVEKHIPVYEVKGNKVHVEVGSILHPMLDNHYIEWILLKSKNGNQRVRLNPGDEPKADFALIDGDEVLEVLAYCNLHGLWKK